MKRIEVLITADGETTVTPIGYKGSECKSATQKLERALGTTNSDKPTPEMYEQAAYTDSEARQ